MRKQDVLKELKVPWITKDGYLDMGKIPIDSVLKQTLSTDEDELRSSCGLLLSMYNAKRPEAAVYLYGLLIQNHNSLSRKEIIIRVLGHIQTKETADLLFNELRNTVSSGSTRSYINTLLKGLRFFPYEIIKDGFEALISDKRWSYRMKNKFKEILGGNETLDWD